MDGHKYNKMQIFYPCKKCIIKSICKISCIEKDDYWKTRNSIVNNVVTTACLLPCIVACIVILNSMLLK